jgi:pimeloyl-ACP methyl ester carboxylesterase
MNNIRGNSYSKRHTRLDPCPTCTDFWAFGFDESSRYDYPATIDHILQQTGHESLYFVGYSMGTTQYLVLLAERPEYNDKIAAGFLLGPTAILGNATNPMVKLADQAEIFQSAAQLVGMDEFMPNFLEVKSRLSHKICHASYLHARMCRNIFALLVGSDPSGLDPATVPTYMSQLPAGASTTTFVHFAQLFRNGGRFSKFDHGTLKNLMIYGSSEAPEYDLAKVTAPTTLYVGDADGFATENDTRVLASKLPNLVSHKVVAKFSHLDFIFSIDAGKLVYAGIIDDLDTRDDEHYCHHPSSCDEI